LKRALQTGLEEFLESFGYDFAQELRATTVRLDRFIEKLMIDYQERLMRSFHEVNCDLSFSVFDKKENNQIDFPIAFKDVSQQHFSKALSYFKNPKSFFEKNEKKFMSDELFQILNPLADHYLKEQAVQLNDHYAVELSDNFTLLLQQMEEQADDFYLSLLSTLDGGVSVERLREIEQKLSE